LLHSFKPLVFRKGRGFRRLTNRLEYKFQLLSEREEKIDFKRWKKPEVVK
jgi:hypothetical protein